MSNEVSTVGDLSGNHVGIDTVRIEHGDSVIEGVMSAITFSAQYERTVDGGRFPIVVTAYISIGEKYELNNIPLSTPASIVTRSRGE